MQGPEATSTTDKRARLRLATKIYVITPAVILLVMAGAAVLSSVLANRIARQAIVADLAAGSSSQETFQQKRYEQLQLISRLFVTDPAVLAYVVEATETLDSVSLLDILGQRQNDLGVDFDFAIILDPEGEVLVRTDRPEEYGEDLSQNPLVAVALEEYHASGVWSQKGGLYHATIVPIVQGFDLLGFMVAGFALTDSTAVELRRVSRTDAAFLTHAGDELNLVASTLSPTVSTQLLAALKERPELMHRVLDDGERVDKVEVSLSGEPWLCLLTPLLDAAGHPVGVTVALASLEKELAPYKRIGMLVVVSGLAAAVAAFVLALAFARRTLQPMRRLAAAATAASHGDYEHPIPVEGDDEVGELALAFHDLLRDLRERRDMETYLGEIYRSLPEREAQPTSGFRPSTAFSPTAVSVDERPTGVLSPTPVGPTGSATHARLTTSHIVPGLVLGQRFEILSELGAGGMAVVYRAHDRQLDEIVALKILKADTWKDTEQLERLKDELRLARKVTHRNVLRTYDLGEIDGISFISMEYVRGITLRGLLQRTENVPYSAGLRLIKELCQGLAAAHDEGVIHRDIKPENLILDPAGTVKLMDFGIARPIRPRSGMGTEEGTLVGTPIYLAPEQIEGQSPDTRVDIYATGVVAYEVFTHQLPFPSGSIRDAILTKLQKDPEPPSTHWREIPEPLERLIMRCLERDPADRFSTVRDLIRALDALRA